MAGGERKDPLREAIERTFAATASTRGRAQELLDEVTRRGREAVSRPIEAIEGMRFASREEVRALENRVSDLSRRVRALETKAQPKG